jgi:hypothetical protein
MLDLHNRFFPYSHHERLIVDRAFDIVQILASVRKIGVGYHYY